MDKKYLDYDGFKVYHKEMVKQIRNLEFDPQRMFDSKRELVDKSNWKFDNGLAYGLKSGLIVTVGDKFWQLVEPEKFNKVLTKIGIDVEEKAGWEPDVLGWRIVGSNTNFDVDNHILKLIK